MNEKTVSEAAHFRRAIRHYTDQPIPREVLEGVLDTVRLTPSAWNIQPWRFIVVTDDAKKHELQKAAYNQPQVGAAQAVFVVYSDMHNAFETLAETTYPGTDPEAAEKGLEGIRGAFAHMSEEEKNAWGRNQTNIALGYLLLTLASHGIASSPMLGFVTEQVRALYGLGDHTEIVALVAVGYPEEEGRTHHRHSIARITRWI
jgi:nitroreductase